MEPKGPWGAWHEGKKGQQDPVRNLAERVFSSCRPKPKDRTHFLVKHRKNRKKVTRRN